MKLVKTAIIASAVMIGATAFGAGFQVQEQGASNLGTSMAGAVTNANNDATAAYNNASAFAFSDLEAGKSIASVGMSLVVPTLGLKDEKGGDYPCAVKSFVPNFFFGHKFTEDLSAMISVTAPFGLESDYEDNFITAGYGIQGMNSYLLTMDVNPTLVYKVTDWFSVTGGVSAQYAYCKLTNAIGANELKLSGQGWGVGGNIGFTVEYMEGGRFAFHWRSAVQQDLSGTARWKGAETGDIDASVKMPDTFTFGIYQRLPGWFDNFAVMLDYTYTRWSTFDELPVSGPGLLPLRPIIGSDKITTPENWKDTSRVSLGFHYYPEDFKKLILRTGVAFDESPVRDAVNRTVRIPCSDRVWYSMGAGYQLADNISVDLSYVYIMTVGNSDINRNENGVNVKGHYYGHIHVISAQLNFTF